MARPLLALNQKLRRSLACFSCLAAAAAALVLAGALLLPPKMEEKQVPAYAYDQQAQVHYRVYLKPNGLYPAESLEPGMVYLTNFVDHINTHFTYRFRGERPAEVRGNYEVTAVVEATDGKEKKVIWRREFLLLPKTGFAGSGREVAVQQVLPVRLPDYNAFAEAVIKSSEFAPEEVKMTVRWNVAVEASTEGGTVREQIAPTMVIPLVRKFFEVGGELAKSKSGAIYTTVSVSAAPAWERLLAPCAAVCGAGLSALLFLLLFTAPAGAAVSPAQQKLRAALKKYGERIVRTDGAVSLAADGAIYVKSLDDLVRIADDLGRPVVCREDSSREAAATFLVLDGERAYVFEFTEESAARAGAFAGTKNLAASG
ncbi:DUF5305 domain-containing protein [Desulfovirgula thermocuniculi]|uniref:DUF5305 domain-containing protein n=1 Tax=Desulfovirgula thermocuniculi TaxID=348842 RepID=UPI0003FD2D9B|nr:DUF5305 domain-containing protein [Desulfovirgula thermocuniculi]